MKIIKYIIFSIIVFLSCFSFVFAKENVLEDVVIKEISGDLNVGTFTYEDDTITPTITFKELNDYVIYQLFLNYDSTLYEIDKITDDNTNNYIKTNYSIVGDKVFMMIRYEEAVEGEFEFDSIKIRIKLKENEKENSIINPQTGLKTIFPILLIILISIGTIVFVKKKKVLFVFLLLIPIYVYAKEDNILEIELSTDNIKISYTVEFYSGEGVTGSIEEIECIYGEVCTLPVNTLEKEGNAFKGWSLEPGGEILYLDEAELLDLISSGKVTLYPVWGRELTIEFNGNGSTSGSVSNLTCVEGEECVLPENEFEKTDYFFIGWSTSDDGEVVYANQEELLDLDDNLSLYAKWFSIITNFDYTGAAQTFTIPANGRYKLEVWGAQGGYNTNSNAGGKGGYSTGIISLNSNTNLYVYVGGRGNAAVSLNNTAEGGFNGGGATKASNWGRGSGGGGTDIRIGTDSLYARVIVAGGGGGATGKTDDMTSEYTETKNPGGGSNGVSGVAISGTSQGYGNGGTQTSGGTNSTGDCQSGGFGYGGGYGNSTCAGGGGGWYGGAGGSASGGGSGYIYTEETASNYPSGCLLNSSYYLSDAETIAGDTSFLSPSGTSETGHAGNGYARITYLGA